MHAPHRRDWCDAGALEAALIGSEVELDGEDMTVIIVMETG